MSKPPVVEMTVHELNMPTPRARLPPSVAPATYTKKVTKNLKCIETFALSLPIKWRIDVHRVLSSATSALDMPTVTNLKELERNCFGRGARARQLPTQCRCGGQGVERRESSIPKGSNGVGQAYESPI
ncbi:hypothetical protein MHU86_8644 [Fragilaria crotonensis]|nr:hypothetical protein MHU86_8644 [Fragilaria crotonensis]